jgi:hypothetical protein
MMIQQPPSRPTLLHSPERVRVLYCVMHHAQTKECPFGPRVGKAHISNLKLVGIGRLSDSPLDEHHLYSACGERVVRVT